MLNSKHTPTDIPAEYVEMVFCQRFHLTPFEFAAMPSKKVELWTIMANIQDNISKSI